MSRRKGDPVLKEAAPFPYRLNAEVTVDYDGSPYKGTVHRIAVDNRTCSIKYNVDASVEPSVSPSRIQTASTATLVPIASSAVPLAPITEEAPTVVEEPPAMEEVPVDVPLIFTSKKSVNKLNKALSRILKGRLKKYRHKAKWCCHLRGEVPYFAASKPSEHGNIKISLTHGTVSMTRTCNLAGWSSIEDIDEYLKMGGELVNEARMICMNCS